MGYAIQSDGAREQVACLVSSLVTSRCFQRIKLINWRDGQVTFTRKSNKDWDEAHGTKNKHWHFWKEDSVSLCLKRDKWWREAPSFWLIEQGNTDIQHVFFRMKKNVQHSIPISKARNKQARQQSLPERDCTRCTSCATSPLGAAQNGCSPVMLLPLHI